MPPFVWSADGFLVVDQIILKGKRAIWLKFDVFWRALKSKDCRERRILLEQKFDRFRDCATLKSPKVVYGNKQFVSYDGKYAKKPNYIWRDYKQKMKVTTETVTRFLAISILEFQQSK